MRVAAATEVALTMEPAAAVEVALTMEPAAAVEVALTMEPAAEARVAHSELELIRWVAELVVTCPSWVAMAVAAPMEAQCMQLAMAWDWEEALGWARALLPLQILGVALGQEHLTQTVASVAQSHRAEAWGARASRELAQWSAPLAGLMSAKDGALTTGEGITTLVKALAATQKRRLRYPTAVVFGRAA